MNYCTNCGEPRREGAAYCPRCGMALDAVPPALRAPAPAPQTKRGLNVYAIIGLALSLSVPLAGLVLSMIARDKAKSGEYSKPLKDLADAGLAVSIVMLVLWAVALVAYAAFGSLFFTQLLKLVHRAAESLALMPY